MDLPKIIGVISLFLTLAIFVFALIADPWCEKEQRKHLLLCAILIEFFGSIFGIAVGIDCKSIVFGISAAGVFSLIALILLLVRRNIPKPTYYC